MKYIATPLPWDSDFFGFDVQKIELLDFQETALSEVFELCRNFQARLTYLVIPGNRAIETRPLNEMFFHDQKIGFELQIDPRKEASAAHDYQISPVDQICEGIRDLAFEAGSLSRFRLDPRFPQGSFEKLYSEWAEKSVRGTLADLVLGAFDKDKPIGFITLKLNSDSVLIGLIAVSRNYQGRGVGQALIREAQRFCKNQKQTVLRVYTQEVNTQAQNFYLKMGFEIVSREHIFHVWRKL